MPWTTTETMDNESTDENLTQDWSGDRYESICSESNDFLKKLDQGTDLKVLLDKRVSSLVKANNKLGLLYQTIYGSGPTNTSNSKERPKLRTHFFYLLRP